MPWNQLHAARTGLHRVLIINAGLAAQGHTPSSRSIIHHVLYPVYCYDARLRMEVRPKGKTKGVPGKPARLFGTTISRRLNMLLNVDSRAYTTRYTTLLLATVLYSKLQALLWRESGLNRAADTVKKKIL
jgi:hypothetical protein